MTLAEKICNLATCPTSMHELKDESIDRGPMPRQPILSENLYIIRNALAPLAIQQASHWLISSESPVVSFCRGRRGSLANISCPPDN